jgi:two-component system sensor histidine kinase KdpD
VRRPDWKGVLLWAAILSVVAALMLLLRANLDKAHVALVLLLVVLGASASAGRAIGVGTAIASFLVFNWFFLPPYYTFVIAEPLDWLVLVAFLITGLVAAQLFHRAQEEARIARNRAAEVDRLAIVGAQTLSVGSADESLRAVTELLRTSVKAERCDIVVRDPGDDSLMTWAMTTGNAAVVQRDGTTHLHAPRPTAADLRALASGSALALLLPLHGKDRIVGVLRIESAAGLRLDRSGWRFLDAMSQYAALAAERVRLVAEAERTEALRETNRLKDALLASVSHDLRTPLTSIKAMAHDLAALGDERAEIIESEADRLNRTVVDLLDLSQLNAGVLPVNIELNAVDDLLGALLQRVEPAIGAERLRIALPPGDPLLMGYFDLVHSLRILANLIENSAKYAPPETSIEVGVARAGSALVFTVADRGPGIGHTHPERLFEPFQRSDGRPRTEKGTGLGLSIARRLAELQRGTLTYAPRVGGGSVFTLTLPAADLVGETPTPLGKGPTSQSL